MDREIFYAALLHKKIVFCESFSPPLCYKEVKDEEHNKGC